MSNLSVSAGSTEKKGAMLVREARFSGKGNALMLMVRRGEMAELPPRT
jgi:hypothetical protein